MTILNDVDFEELMGEAAYLKAGFLGLQGSGKTHTAVEVAIGVREFFALKEPIGFIDTESGSDYTRKLIEARTGRPAIGKKTRSFSDLLRLSERAPGRVSVLLVDSVTHFWMEVVDSYLRDVNARLKSLAESAGRSTFAERRTLEPEDWQIVKGKWREWTDWFLNAPVHVIVCGRAGYEYEDREDEEGNKESVKVGVKMRAEGDFGYESALLVEMQRSQRFDGDHTVLHHRATVLKDKFHGCLDGKSMENPTFEFFRPHIERLNPAGYQPVDVSSKTDHGVMGGDRSWHYEKRDRAILWEEIDGEVQRAHPGQTAAEKQARRDILQKVFGTWSVTAISESMHSDRMRRGLAELRAILRPPPSLTASTDPGDQIPEWSESDLNSDGAARAPASLAVAPAPGAAAGPEPSAAPAAAPEGDTSTAPVTELVVFERGPDGVSTYVPETGASPAVAPPPRKPRAPRGSRKAAAAGGQTTLGGEAPAATAPQDSQAPSGPELSVDEQGTLRDLELTAPELSANPDYLPFFEAKLRSLPAHPRKGVLWEAFLDASRKVTIEAAKAEAAARLAGEE